MHFSGFDVVFLRIPMVFLGIPRFIFGVPVVYTKGFHPKNGSDLFVP